MNAFLHHFFHPLFGAGGVILRIPSDNLNIVGFSADFNAAFLINPLGAGFYTANIGNPPCRFGAAGHADKSYFQSFSGNGDGRYAERKRQHTISVFKIVFVFMFSPFVHDF